MNRLFVGMDMHKEEIVSAGLAQELNVPLFREAFAGNDFPRLVKRCGMLWQVPHRIGQTPDRESDKRRFAFRTEADTVGRWARLLCD